MRSQSDGAKHNSVYGHIAPCARMTKTAAMLIAVLLAIPVFVILSVVDWVFL